jgi:outer membrane protein OmpA-like peptidoglycan-associated protein/tetratricopeptide (TPR) repeat protein
MNYLHKIYLFFFAVLMLALPCKAKDNKDLLKANYYYTHQAYLDAIPFFEKIAETNSDPDIYTKLADCYSITGQTAKAAQTYAKAVASKDCHNMVRMRYAQLLMQLMKYDDAITQLKAYQTNIKGTDNRAQNMIAGCNYALLLQQGVPTGIATLLPFNTHGSDFAPTYKNGKLIFASDTSIELKKKKDNTTGRTYYNIYSVASDTNGNSTNMLQVLTSTKEINNKYHNGPATFSADGKQMYYTRSSFKNKLIGGGTVPNKDSTVALEIMIATDYDTATGAFKTINPYQHNNKDYAVAHPSVSPDGKLMALSCDKPRGQGRSDIYLSKKMGANKWSAPLNAGKTINTEGDEVFPYWANNETLYFSSDGHAGQGGLDVYRCIYNAQNNTFSQPENVGTPINSSSDDISLAISSNAHKAWFSSNRPATKGGDNIYFYRKMEVYLLLRVLDSATQLPIAQSGIAISASNDNRDTLTNPDGLYSTRLYPGISYNLTASKAGYLTSAIKVIASSSKETDTLTKTIYLSAAHKVENTDPLPVATAAILRHQNVMDSPGVRQFQLNEIYEVGDFYYGYNKYQLTDAHQRFLDTLLVQLKRHPEMRIEIMAHTDCRGSVASNKTLSDRRAKAVADYLISKGIYRQRLQYLGLGFTRPKVNCPVCTECTEQQHYLNRILEFRVLQL